MEQAVQEQLQKKWRVLLPITAMFFIFYFGLPFTLTYFLDWMNSPSPLMNITWGWLYAFAQIPLTWLLIGIYYMQMKKMDRQLEKLSQGDAA